MKVTAETITDADLRGLICSHSLESPTWRIAKAALDGDQQARRWCADRLNAFASSGLTPAGHYPSLCAWNTRHGAPDGR